MSRPDGDWVPAIRSLEDISNLPRQYRPGRTVITCCPDDVDAWKAGAEALGLDVAVIVTPGLPEGTALTWNAVTPGPTRPVSFTRYYRYLHEERA